MLGYPDRVPLRARVSPTADYGPRADFFRDLNVPSAHPAPPSHYSAALLGKPKYETKDLAQPRLAKQWVDPATSVNFRAFRRTCATWFQKVGTTKDIQAQLRHTTPMTTLGVYVQELPESVRTAVEALDQKLCGVAVAQPTATVQ